VDDSPALDSILLKQIIEKETPYLADLISEFASTAQALNGKLKPMLDKIRAKQVGTTKHGMTYLEMKYNLLLSYCSFLSFYILLKTEGVSTKDHPVIGKLLYIKTLLERLRPLDQKLQYQVDKVIRTAALSEVPIAE
jgi:U3 small nucleolar RNA-associated protein 3